MNSFCKMVGFPIVRHEAQCVALFRLLEQECLEVVNDGCIWRPIKSSQKGLRELWGLVSIVIMMGHFLIIEVRRTVWGLLAVVNDFKTSFLEC